VDVSDGVIMNVDVCVGVSVGVGWRSELELGSEFG